MKKRKRERVLALILFFVLASVVSVANATLIIVDANAYTANISEVVVVKISSDAAASPTDWGVYLRSNPANADLQNAAVIKTTGAVNGAGNQASLQLTDPGGYDGDDYQAKTNNQGDANKMIYTGVDWSTVEFVASAAGTYYVDLYDYTLYVGSSYSSPPTVDYTKTITVVPEPATIALLGLGGLLLIRRRK